MKKIKQILTVLLAVFLIILICIYPEKAKESAQNGIIISLKVIIPSLFPFMFLICILSETVSINNCFEIYAFSALGGYPVGAKLIEESYKKGTISKKSAVLMQCFCVNAGPAFIISAVGVCSLGSKKAGYILLASHIISSFGLMMALIPKIKFQKNNEQQNNEFFLSEIIIKSCSNAGISVLNISFFVIIFSLFSGFLEKFKIIACLFEISNAVQLTDNIYFLSFLLGFSGICVWFQIISVSKECGVNLPLFCLSRIIHGGLSALLTFFQIKIFNIKINSVSVLKNKAVWELNNNAFLAISILIMFVVLIIELNNKKYSGNFKKNIV